MASTLAASPKWVIAPARRESTAMVDSVVLAGSVGPHASWAYGYPRFLLPLPRRTMIETLITRLCRRASGTCTICTDGWTENLPALVRMDAVLRHRVSIQAEPVPRGSAGCLKASAARIRGGPVLLARASVRLDDDPSNLVAEHIASGRALTIFCARRRPGAGLSDRRRLRPAGIYCLDPEVLPLIPETGYHDLEEQLLPALRHAGLPVGAIALTGDTCEVADWRTYLAMLQRALTVERPPDEGFHSPAPGVWFGQGVQVASDARIVGPVLLGHGCRVDHGALIIGPAVLGDGSEVGAESCLMRVIAPASFHCPADVGLADRIVWRPAVPDAMRGTSVTDGRHERRIAITGPSNTNRARRPAADRAGWARIGAGLAGLLALLVWVAWQTLGEFWHGWRHGAYLRIGLLAPLADGCTALACPRELGGMLRNGVRRAVCVIARSRSGKECPRTTGDVAA